MPISVKNALRKRLCLLTSVLNFVLFSVCEGRENEKHFSFLCESDYVHWALSIVHGKRVITWKITIKHVYGTENTFSAQHAQWRISQSVYALQMATEETPQFVWYLSKDITQFSNEETEPKKENRTEWKKELQFANGKRWFAFPSMIKAARNYHRDFIWTCAILVFRASFLLTVYS